MPKLFVGIPVSEEYEARLNSMVETLRGRLRSRVSWTKPGKWHVTLQFLGKVDEEKVDEIRDALRLIEFLDFPMRAGSLEYIPNVHGPRILWMDIKEGAETCIELAEAVEEVMAAFDFKQNENFKPHLTLGRVKQIEGGDDFGVACAGLLQAWPVLQVESFCLYKSEQTAEGHIYTVVEEFPLWMDSGLIPIR
ncbi:RNA 2',3'-cyclic phosphodiesterase [Halodesulfovibrio marinisediminis]|uniref:RNA 2',3'-cyclic phosphodiesterase n=1 Tax=Halodesulfovibrio marinisediminis DSM 17456 TaxID=1121457 RepID=A0A1N6EAS1_9BACT|nr:RNA 2',3'-cyclic phosphodiesterase [Halodesulfovibrio marinisediminis]SIN80130.1 2'-5' RNA ligase [Halodesulfovibrio marinisediminis DSM 17456]